jgi:hypothetical protein
MRRSRTLLAFFLLVLSKCDQNLGHLVTANLICSPGDARGEKDAAFWCRRGRVLASLTALLEIITTRDHHTE